MSYVPPTLEGRVLVDLGQQLTAMRARAEQAEADAFKFRGELVALQIDHDNLRHALTVEGQYRTQADAENAQLTDRLSRYQILNGEVVGPKERSIIEQLQADNARLKVALTTCQQVMEIAMAKHEADNARLRAALEVLRYTVMQTDIDRIINAALAATPDVNE